MLWKFLLGLAGFAADTGLPMLGINDPTVGKLLLGLSGGFLIWAGWDFVKSRKRVLTTVQETPAGIKTTEQTADGKYGTLTNAKPSGEIEQQAAYGPGFIRTKDITKQQSDSDTPGR